MKDKIIIVVLILLIAGVARSHYKIKRIESELSNVELQLKEVEDKNVLLQNDVNLVEGNQIIIVDYLFPKEEEVRVPITEPNPFDY